MRARQAPRVTLAGGYGHSVALAWAAMLLLVFLTLCAGSLQAQSLPFAIGERLVYSVRVAKVKTVGKGTMQVTGPVDVRGTETWRLSFDFQAGLGPVKAVDKSESWVDPRRMAALRFSKHEKHPLTRQDQKVEIHPEQRHWVDAEGGSGQTMSDAPLDELSFMYFLRTVPLATDSTYQFNRHFDAGRNPTTVRVVRREQLTTGAGTFPTVLVEMRVRDAKHYKGDGIIRINLTDDAARVPVRIESAMPVVGTAVLSLESVTRGAGGAVIARRDGAAHDAAP